MAWIYCQTLSFFLAKFAIFFNPFLVGLFQRSFRYQRTRVFLFQLFLLGRPSSRVLIWFHTRQFPFRNKFRSVHIEIHSALEIEKDDARLPFTSIKKSLFWNLTHFDSFFRWARIRRSSTIKQSLCGSHKSYGVGRFKRSMSCHFQKKNFG